MTTEKEMGKDIPLPLLFSGSDCRDETIGAILRNTRKSKDNRVEETCVTT